MDHQVREDKQESLKGDRHHLIIDPNISVNRLVENLGQIPATEGAIRARDFSLREKLSKRVDMACQEA